MTLAIDGRALTKTYGTGALATPVLKGVDFQVKRGEFVMLSGPSGSGKTTLLSILGCVLSASTGTLRLFDTEVSAIPESRLSDVRLQTIGFIFQGHNLIASLSVGDNITLPLELRGWTRREASKEAARMLDRVGLAEKVDALPGDLSGGQRQRVSIARALAGTPPIVLADEPTASLDAQNGLRATELLREAAREAGTTVVIVTHDNRIFHLADRIAHIEDGMIRPDTEATA